MYSNNLTLKELKQAIEESDNRLANLMLAEYEDLEIRYLANCSPELIEELTQGETNVR